MDGVGVGVDGWVSRTLRPVVSCVVWWWCGRCGADAAASWHRGGGAASGTNCTFAAGVAVVSHCACDVGTVDGRSVGLEHVAGATRERGALGRS